MRYNPALDGLRAVACLLVLLSHTHAPLFPAGNFGVEVFFVLSGYLITRVLDEKGPTLGQFYLARFRRLMPALAFMVLVYLAVAPFFLAGPHLRDAAVVLLYSADITKLLWGWPEYLGHAWSLGIEEKFYLLWPLIFLRYRPNARTLLLAFVAFTLWRFHDGTDVSRLRFDLHLSGLVLGCAISRLPKVALPGWPALLVILGCAYYFYPDGYLMRCPGVLLVELATAWLLLCRQPAWLGWSPLAYIGRLSYGIYLWHYPIAMALAPYLPWPELLTVTLVASVALAALSYHTVEAWFRVPRRSYALRMQPQS